VGFVASVKRVCASQIQKKRLFFNYFEKSFRRKKRGGRSLPSCQNSERSLEKPYGPNRDILVRKLDNISLVTQTNHHIVDMTE